MRDLVWLSGAGGEWNWRMAQESEVCTKKGSSFINQKSQANRRKSKSRRKINKRQMNKKLTETPQPHIKPLATTLPQSRSQWLYIGYPTWPLPNWTKPLQGKGKQREKSHLPLICSETQLTFKCANKHLNIICFTVNSNNSLRNLFS